MEFLNALLHYCVELLPALIVGLIMSGVVNEFISNKWVEEHLGGNGIKGILLSTLVGAIVPVCCWGSLPIAVSFKKKGASLGAVFAILIATPATSINAVMVMWRFMGLPYALYVFCSVIAMGIIAGIIGNRIHVPISHDSFQDHDHHHSHGVCCSSKKSGSSIKKRVVSILHYAFIQMPKEIGVELLIGVSLAAFVASYAPIGTAIQTYLTQGYDYFFSIGCGLVMYMCATMSVPLVHAFVEQGLGIGAGLVLLIVGPITSYGTILVIRKEFGFKVLFLFLFMICMISTGIGILYQLVS